MKVALNTSPVLKVVLKAEVLPKIKIIVDVRYHLGQARRAAMELRESSLVYFIDMAMLDSGEILDKIPEPIDLDPPEVDLESKALILVK
jgi:hypothetical protein